MLLSIKNGYIEIVQKDDIMDIDIYIDRLEDLYALTNYSSFKSRALNPELEKHILNSVQNYKLKTNIRLVLHLPAASVIKNIPDIKQSINNHFAFKAKETEAHLKRKFRQWRLNLCIGTVFLAACFALLEIFEGKVETNGTKLLKESLLIMGWVSLWEPITFILFGWHPILKKKMYYQKLSDVSVSMVKYMNRSRKFESKK